MMTAKKLEIRPGVNPLEGFIEDGSQQGFDAEDDYLEALYVEPNTPQMSLGGGGLADQKTRVIMKNPRFDVLYHKQWVDEDQQQEYLIHKHFNFVPPSEVASSWAHPLTGDVNPALDRVRIYVGISAHGGPRFNVLMFIPQSKYEEYLRSLHKSSTMQVEQVHSELDASLITTKYTERVRT